MAKKSLLIPSYEYIMGLPNFMEQGPYCRSNIRSVNQRTFSLQSRDSDIGIATGYGLNYQWVRVRILVRARIFTSSCRPDRPRFHPTSYPVVPGALSPRVKRPRREADHLPPTSAEVKKTWMYTSNPPYVFMAY
jgi:hypothetical protein